MKAMHFSQLGAAEDSNIEQPQKKKNIRPSKEKKDKTEPSIATRY